MLKIEFQIVCSVIVIMCCTAAQFTGKQRQAKENVLTAASFTTVNGVVLYEFSKPELDTLDGIFCSANHEKYYPVTSPAWNSYLKLTFKSGECVFYLMFDQFIKQIKSNTDNCYMFTKNIYWLYDKAEEKLGKASKEYRKIPKGL